VKVCGQRVTRRSAFSEGEISRLDGGFLMWEIAETAIKNVEVEDLATLPLS